MPKATTTKSASTAAKKSSGNKKWSIYNQFCADNREQFKIDFPDLNGKEINAKLSDAWWESDENPKKGERPERKTKKGKKIVDKENTPTKPKGSKKGKKAAAEASSDE